jgi:hypothetical protein
MKRLHMLRQGVPRLGDNSVEIREVRPKILKLERSGASWA